MSAVTRQGRILVVDDEPEVRAALEEFLGPKGYEIRTAADGAAAVCAVIDEDLDVVLLDIKMPRLGGLEALTAIRAIAPGVRIIMLSGQADIELAKRTLAFGAFDYIAKPFDLAYLAQSIDTAIAIRRLESPAGMSESGATVQDKRFDIPPTSTQPTLN